MKVVAIYALRYDLPLVSPMKLAKEVISSRQGFIICLESEESFIGYGEIAPLPGLHNEDIKEALRQLNRIKPELINSKIPEDIMMLKGGFGRWLGKYNLVPTVRFGIEMAVLDLCAKAEDKALYKLLSKSSHRIVPVNGLISGDPEQIRERALKLVGEGYETLKIKVGRLPLASDIMAVRSVCEALGDGVKIRLDANRSWSLADALRFCKSVSKYNIDYIEEPVGKPEELTKFCEDSGMPVALDESLCRAEPKKLKLPRGVKALILKPCVLGGLERTAEFVMYAKAYGLIPVISSAFYSGLTLCALAQFAAAYLHPNVAVGLDTYKLLGEDLLGKRFSTNIGCVDAQKAYCWSKTIRFDLLNPI